MDDCPTFPHFSGDGPGVSWQAARSRGARWNLWGPLPQSHRQCSSLGETVLVSAEHLTPFHRNVGSTGAGCYTALDLTHSGGACTILNVPIESKYCAVRGHIHLPVGSGTLENCPGQC